MKTRMMAQVIITAAAAVGRRIFVVHCSFCSLAVFTTMEDVPVGVAARNESLRPTLPPLIDSKHVVAEPVNMSKSFSGKMEG